MKNYSNIISLGYFCPVAIELEKLGLRSKSAPFDWCISKFSGIIDCINNQFVDFLEYSLLEQRTDNHRHYRNNKYAISFYHDFNKYQSLSQQLPEVKLKYEKRISRFLNDLQSQTLFIRYISDDPDELKYIEDNIPKISEMFNNNIIFLAPQDIKSEIIKIFNVDQTYDGNFYHINLESNEELMQLLNSVNIPNRENNINFYKAKEKRKNNKFKKIVIRLRDAFNRRFKTEYTHFLQYDERDKFKRKIYD